MRRFVIVGVLVVIMTVLVYLFLTNAGLLPVEAAQQAVTIDWMFNLQFALIAFFGSLIMVFIGYSLVVFRRKQGETGDGAYFKGNSRLEIVWTVVPLIIVIALAYIGSQNLAEVRHEDSQAMVVNVTAFQWNWEFSYPDYGITSNSLYLPVDKQVLLKLTSRDVIHSFWVPEFRVKQDALPGANLVKELRINPTLIGEYKVRCAELCGGAHAAMESPVVVVSKADFDAWVSKESASTVQDPVGRGQKLAESQCKACHSFDGTGGVGPTWKGLAGSKVDLADGSSATADDEFLKESIVLPAAKIVKGFQNIMPATYKSSLSDQQVSDLIAFIKSLK
jgi:cytochrome c oxidase subunit 2